MRKPILGVILVVLLAGLGGVAYLWFAGGSGEPSTGLTAPPIAADTDPPDSAGDGAQPGELVITEATATFEVDELLRGEPNHIVGTTSEVAGRIRLDRDDLAATVLSDIVINARTFATDSSNRDRAMRGPIVLDSASDEFELITFSPTSVDGLGGPAVVGEELGFTITGDLTIKGVTNPVTFDVVASLAGEAELVGTATASVDRTEWGIDIPSIATVADVTEEVLLTLEFTATS